MEPATFLPSASSSVIRSSRYSTASALARSTETSAPRFTRTCPRSSTFTLRRAPPPMGRRTTPSSFSWIALMDSIAAADSRRCCSIIPSCCVRISICCPYSFKYIWRVCISRGSTCSTLFTSYYVNRLDGDITSLQAVFAPDIRENPLFCLVLVRGRDYLPVGFPLVLDHTRAHNFKRLVLHDSLTPKTQRLLLFVPAQTRS